MNSYTVYWNTGTWKKYAALAREDENVLIDYVAAKNAWPFSIIENEDEIFVLNIEDGKLRVAGRLVSEGTPVNKEIAKKRLGDGREFSWEIYAIGKPEFDNFRPNAVLPMDVAKRLEFTNRDGNVTYLEHKSGSGLEQQSISRGPRRLSSNSADILRNFIGPIVDLSSAELLNDLDEIDLVAVGDDPTERLDSRLSRIGQGKFRRNTIETWREEKCAVTGIAVPELLNASHIIPWKDDVGKRKLGSNGVLLSASLDRLFDRHLIGFQPEARGDVCRIVVAPRLKTSFAQLSRIGISEKSVLDLSAVKRTDVLTLKANLSLHLAIVLDRT